MKEIKFIIPQILLVFSKGLNSSKTVMLNCEPLVATQV